MRLLTRWQPFGSLREEMDRLFDRWTFGEPSWPGLAVSYPPVNVWEDEEFVYAEAELPGMKLEDIEIYVTGEDQLTLKGVRHPLTPEKVEWHRQERGFGPFERVVPLPIPVVPAKVEAKLEFGVLTVKMAKKPEVKPRKIVVQAG